MIALLARWLDNERSARLADGASRRIDVARVVPFIALHVACGAVLWVGVSPAALVACAVSYLLRMFAITAFYHRYFAHRAFRAGRITQFAFAALGAAATQRGPLWWASHHRAHHQHADTLEDPHRPADGLFWSHMGWFLSDRHFVADPARVRDWRRFPELVWLDRFDLVVPVVYALLLFALGAWVGARYPALGTDGWQFLVWGYVVSTVLLLHATLLVNSLAHVWGHRRFETRDRSRNNALIALLTLGEGWHNNHHRYAASARQGFYWWQFDPSYWVLVLLARLGLIHDLRPVPARVLAEGRRS